MLSEIDKLRESLPELLTLEEYCALRERSRASAFNDMRRVAGLAVKIGPRGQHTRIKRDVALDEMAKAQTPQPWVPLKDPAPAKGAAGEEINTQQEQDRSAAQTRLAS
jgi:hypothetical protein